MSSDKYVDNKTSEILKTITKCFKIFTMKNLNPNVIQSSKFTVKDKRYVLCEHETQ